jgi:hypothetical protein
LRKSGSLVSGKLGRSNRMFRLSVTNGLMPGRGLAPLLPPPSSSPAPSFERQRPVAVSSTNPIWSEDFRQP